MEIKDGSSVDRTKIVEFLPLPRKLKAFIELSLALSTGGCTAVSPSVFQLFSQPEQPAIVSDLGTPQNDIGFSTLPAPEQSPTPVVIVIDKVPTIAQAKTKESPSPSPIPSETVIASPKVLPTEVVSPSPTKTTTIEPSLTATLTSTPEDYGYGCDLDGMRKELAEENKIKPLYMIEAIKSDNSSDVCLFKLPSIADFKYGTLFSQLWLDGITDEKQRETIFEQCKELSLSIFTTPPPEIPGVTFGREVIQGEWVNSVSLEKLTDQLWLLYNPNIDACEWKVIH
jgi:hypothetical protein